MLYSQGLNDSDFDNRNIVRSRSLQLSPTHARIIMITEGLHGNLFNSPPKRGCEGLHGNRFTLVRREPDGPGTGSGRS